MAFCNRMYRYKSLFAGHSAGAANCTLNGKHSKATLFVRIAQVLGHLSYSLGKNKEALTNFAEQLNEPGYDRTLVSYAAMLVLQR